MANDIEAVRAAFLAWIRDDGYLVPSAVTDIEWDDEGLPVYYTRDDGERHYLDGEWHAWQAATSRAALAVAPATATDRLAGMPPHFHFGGEAIAALESAGMGRNGKPNCLIDMILEACNALRAATPATGDAAAVREACAKAIDKLREEAHSDDDCDEDWWDGYDGGCEDASATIRALPLPAPATAVEEAQAWKYLHLLRHAHGLLMGGKAPADPDRHSAFLNEIDALLAAEAAATHAAKGGV